MELAGPPENGEQRSDPSAEGMAHRDKPEVWMGLESAGDGLVQCLVGKHRVRDESDAFVGAARFPARRGAVHVGEIVLQVPRAPNAQHDALRRLVAHQKEGRRRNRDLCRCRNGVFGVLFLAAPVYEEKILLFQMAVRQKSALVALSVFGAMQQALDVLKVLDLAHQAVDHRRSVHSRGEFAVERSVAEEGGVHRERVPRCVATIDGNGLLSSQWIERKAPAIVQLRRCRLKEQTPKYRQIGTYRA